MMATITSDNRLRQISMLVASVDGESARHLLLNLPTDIARKVRAMAAEMGPIPPEERKALMLELQKAQSRTPTKPSGVQSTGPAESDSGAPNSDHFSASSLYSQASSLNSQASSLNSQDSQQSLLDIPAADAPAWTRLSVEAMVRFVRHERPTVIAVIVHQLSARQAAAVLQRLPRSISREVLRCFGTLQEINPEAMQAIDEHLSERLSEYRHKIENEIENTRRINELLAAAPPELKQQWANWIQPEVFEQEDQPTSAARSSHSPSGSPFESSLQSTLDQIYQSATITTNDAFSSDTTRVPNPFRAMPQHARQDDSESGTPMTIPFPSKSSMGIELATRMEPPDRSRASTVDQSLNQLDFERILTLSAEQLASLLSGLDSQTVLLSLAGASPQFMRRFNAMLEPSDAKVLGDRIRKVGPLQLRDIDEAQRRVVQAYWNLIQPVQQRKAA